MSKSGPEICMYFQVHQPFRLGRYSCFEVGLNEDYFDSNGNRELLRRIAQKSYIPTIRRLRVLLESLGERFAFGLSFSGTVLEQLREYAPEALLEFQNLVKSPRVEILAETYHHSLSSLYSAENFQREVERHTALIQELFNRSPKVFRNTELIYSDVIGSNIYEMGFKGALIEERAGQQEGKTVFHHPDVPLLLLMRNRNLSDEIAFRFPLLRELSCEKKIGKFLNQVAASWSGREPLGIFIDFETFGEHHWEETGIFDFLEMMPEVFISEFQGRFLLPSEVFLRHVPDTPLSVNHAYSWADTERDLSAWIGNSMQKKAVSEAYELLNSLVDVSESSEEILGRIKLNLSYLLTSDHFYYMSTKKAGDGAVHSYFSPYESPYDAFIRYMNVLRDVTGRVERYRFNRSMHQPTNAVHPV